MHPVHDGTLFLALFVQYAHLIYRESGMFAPGKGFLEIGAGSGDGESFIRLSELKFEAVS